MRDGGSNSLRGRQFPAGPLLDSTPFGPEPVGFEFQSKLWEEPLVFEFGNEDSYPLAVKSLEANSGNGTNASQGDTLPGNEWPGPLYGPADTWGDIVIATQPPTNAIPEVAFGTIMASLSMLITLAVFVARAL